MKERHPLHSKEHLHRMNHYSRVAYLELKYASYCRQLKDGEISREFFDEQTGKVLALLGDAEWMRGGNAGQIGSGFSHSDYDLMSERWREVAERQKNGDIPEKDELPDNYSWRK